MRHAERKKGKDKIAVTLILCFCVIALTSIFTIRANINKINSSANLPVSDRTPSVQPERPSHNEESILDAAAPIPSVDSRDQNLPDPLPQQESPAASGHQFASPVKAETPYVSNPYSMDSLIYSVTLDQFMTHSGVDIQVPEDSQVLAIADGIITAVYHDDRYGSSLELNLGNGYTAIYSNLSDASMVESGDTVTKGEIIGGVGTSGLFESLEPAHLHLELLSQGTLVDPMDYIRLN